MEKILELLKRAERILVEIQDPAIAEKWSRRGWTKSALLAERERALEIIAEGDFNGDPITAIRTFRGRPPLGGMKHIADVRDGDF